MTERIREVPQALGLRTVTRDAEISRLESLSPFEQARKKYFFTAEMNGLTTLNAASESKDPIVKTRQFVARREFLETCADQLEIFTASEIGIMIGTSEEFVRGLRGEN